MNTRMKYEVIKQYNQYRNIPILALLSLGDTIFTVIGQFNYIVDLIDWLIKLIDCINVHDNKDNTFI